MNPSNQPAQENSFKPDKIMGLIKEELAKEPKSRIAGSVPLRPYEYLAMDPDVATLQRRKRDEIEALLESGVSLADALEPQKPLAEAA